MKEIARFEITGDRERNRMMAILGSSGYPVRTVNVRDEKGVFIGIRVVVYEKEDK